MNTLAKLEGDISAQTMEHVLGTGDLSKLTTQQRVEYYLHVCRSLGVNPSTRPFRFMTFQGQTVLYATRDLTDQLRSLRKINIRIVDKQLEGELFIVTAQAIMPDGRRDEDVGAVNIGQLKGDARANAIMKGLTKAKRRVTLSICGLGFLDEMEVETLRGATTYDVDDISLTADGKPEHRPTMREKINEEVPIEPPKDTQADKQARWFDALQAELNDAIAAGPLHVAAIADRPQVKAALAKATGANKQAIEDMLSWSLTQAYAVEAKAKAEAEIGAANEPVDQELL